MNQADLSPEQERVLDPNVRVVEAGPGSGKTRALVARYLKTASSTKQGVALLSFTNAAVDEVKRRAGPTPQYLRAPHFVGTIDSFLHRFIVTPEEVARLGRLPSYLPSWDDLPSEVSVIHISGLAGAGIPLSAFRIDSTDEVSVTGAGWRGDAYLGLARSRGREMEVLRRARALILGMRRTGIYDAGLARTTAYKLLNGRQGQAIIDRLSLRFEELLIDEAQDCDEAEMSVIRVLGKRIRTVIMADPDQAIFEFRGSKPKLFTDYRDEQEDSARAKLSCNFRSSKSICDVVRLLRAAGTADIYPWNEEATDPVYVLGGSPSEQGEKFSELLGVFEINPSDCIVLSHRGDDAVSVCGTEPPAGFSSAPGNRIAGACAVLRTASRPEQRLAAVKQIENAILGLVAWPSDDIKCAGRARQLEELDRSPEWLRGWVGSLVTAVLPVIEAQNFGSVVRVVVAEALADLAYPSVSLSARLKKPSDEVWTYLFSPFSGALK